MSKNNHNPSHDDRKQVYALALGALGVVFGDIGTSPLYAMKEAFTGPHSIVASPANVLGVLSIIFWVLIFVVVIKYLTFIMRADNRGREASLRFWPY